VESCHEKDGSVLGEDVARIRSSHIRMKLADPPAAAARFVPYAAMSALAYAEDQDCGHAPKITARERNILEDMLTHPRDQGQKWERVRSLERAGPCEDELGLFYNVWKKETADLIEVVVAFRGTWGPTDWWYGNLRWFTRFFTTEDQYTRARQYSHEVIEAFKSGAGQQDKHGPIRFYSTGHSLGGGLAQDVFYDRPRDYVQVFAFDPSAVTTFTDEDEQTQIAGCSCEPSLGTEARIYRFYESYEILTHLRFVHKLFFAPNRHIHEVRFGFPAPTNPISRHSMVALATDLDAEARREDASLYTKPWYSGKGEGCTARFEAGQRTSCSVSAGTGQTCP
jgi:hypothetical protein